MHQLIDAELVALACADDTEAFRLLLERYQTMAFAIALQQVFHLETAQDLVQEAMLQAYLSLDQLRDPDRFKSWFYGIVLNVCRNWRRRQASNSLSYLSWNEAQYIIDPTDLFEAVEDHELRCAVQCALQKVSTKNCTVMLLFYHEDLSLGEIATRLNLSLTAVKSRLHEGRNQLKKQLLLSYPELSFPYSSKHRRKTMTTMRVVKVAPQEQRALVILLDQPGRHVLPLWLSPMEGFPIAVALKQASVPKMLNEPTPIDFVSHLLQATGATIQSVHVDELQERLLYARLFLHSNNGQHEIKARLGDALALAVSENSPIMVADDIVKRMSVNLPLAENMTTEKQIEQAIQTLTTKKPFPPSSGLPRIKEPQNLRFTEGLQRWELRGPFLLDQAGTHWKDYVQGTEPIGPEAGAVSGFLKAQVAQPLGFADLRQAILADDYRGRRVRLSADIKVADVEQQGGLYLRVVDPGRTKTDEEREQTVFQGSQDWTRYETQIHVPADSVFVLFGISLTGRGQIWVTNVRLESIQ